MPNQRIKEIESGKVPLVSMHSNGKLTPQGARIINKRFSQVREALDPELEKIRDSRRIPSDLMRKTFR